MPVSPYADLNLLLMLFLVLPLFTNALPLEVLARTVGPIQQQTQQPSNTTNVADEEKDIRRLEPGKHIKSELAGGQKHTYRIRLSADQFLKAIMEQNGIDLVVQVSGPDGKQILEFDSESRLQGQEPVSLVAEAAGDYRLAVEPKLQRASAGSYEIRIEELRAATDTDRALHDACKRYEESLELQRAGKYDEALPLAERVLEVRERLLGAEHRDVAAAINGLAGIYLDRGEYVKAEPLYKRAIDIREKAPGKDHPATATSLNKLALVYQDLGKYVEAEPLYKRALEIREKALSKDHPDTAQSLNNLALLYRTQGNYVEAEAIYKRALDICEKALGKDDPATAIILSNLALLYSRQGKYIEAEPLYKRALEIREKALSKDHPDTARALNNLAELYRTQGNYVEAEPIYKRALDIYEKARGEDHPDTAHFINGLANLYFSQGKYAEAEPLYKRALSIREKRLSNDHPDTVTSLHNLAILYLAKGDPAQAGEFQSRANAASERNLTRNLAISSERQKLGYLATLSRQTDKTLSLHLLYAPNDPITRNLAAATILQRKARALDATSENLNALRSRFNAEDRALLDRLTQTRSQLARFILNGPQKMTIEQYRGRIKELEDQAEQYEVDISRRSAEFSAQSLPVTLEAVQAAIPDDAALIEFATYRPFDAKAAKPGEYYGQPHYVAYILRHDGDIQWKILGEAKAIDQAIAALREASRNPNRNDVKRLARSVDEKIFQPVRPLLGKLTRLLISPDGTLNLIPFAALVDEQGRFLVERYSISYLTSGRDLLRLQVARESKNPPLVVAAPDFGEPNEVEVAQAPKPKIAILKDKSKDRQIAASARSTIRKFSFLPLPYTAQEGESLRTLLPDSTLLTKRQATKAALQQVRSPRLLHIATHGFFLEDLKLTPPGGRGYEVFDVPERILKSIEERGVRVENPLLRSGLALAGANEHKEEDNGILTALEVTGLNLWGTKLVVLSACDTGVGEVKNGDGVHGLRRALVLAGSETQVMSLWAVLDKATRDLMVAYYRNLKQGHGRGEALRQVQLEMLKQVRRRHPYYWASFIQSGEWANLDGQR